MAVSIALGALFLLFLSRHPRRIFAVLFHLPLLHRRC